MSKPSLGISGSIAKNFLTTEITPLLALVGLLLGLFAVLVTPREEDPQINVTFANVYIPFPGASADQVENLVSTPAEQVLSEIEGLEHVYSTSMPGMPGRNASKPAWMAPTTASNGASTAGGGATSPGRSRYHMRC